MAFLLVFTKVITLIATLIYLLDKYLLSYWTKRGFFQAEPSFFFGNFGDSLKGKKTFGEVFADAYKKYKGHKLMGFYFSYRTALVVNDPEYIQDVMIRDFNSFHDRGLPLNEEKNPLSAHLFLLTGQRWRDLRVKLSPTFTSGKLKGMYPTIRDCANVLEEYLIKNNKNGTDVFDFRDLLARYTTNTISSVAFGVDNDCINDRENIFRQMGIKNFSTTAKSRFVRLIAFLGMKRFLLSFLYS